MTALFRWAMRNGAGILFTVSLLIFLISFAGQFAIGRGAFGGFSTEPGEASGRLWFLLATFGNALSQSALTFFGACFLYRLDAAWPAKGRGR